MIAPRSRLVLWTALVAVPMGILYGITRDAALVVLIIMAMFFVVIALDAALGLSALDGISIELPNVLRLVKDREGIINVLINNPSGKARKLRLGLDLPAALAPVKEDVMALLPADSPASTLHWACKPLQRGNYSVEKCYLEAESPLGLWSIRGSTRAQSQVRVYPNLTTDRKRIAALFLNRGAFGAHAQRQVGKGREFEKLREYCPGDSFDEIHWKATARRQRPVTKVFQIERTQEVYVVIDTSRLSGRRLAADTTGVETTMLERFINAGLILGAVAERQGDLFGLATFDDKVRTFVRAKNGQAHYSVCRDSLYTLSPRPVTPDFDEICSFLRLRLRRRALLIFLTSLDDPMLAESFTRNMDLLHRRHLVIVNMIQAPGIGPLFAKPDVDKTDDLYTRLAGHLQWRKLAELGKILQRRAVPFSLVENESLSASVASQYLNVKRRQLL